jgi:transposase
MDDVRRCAIREKYGRRGRSGDPGYGIKHLLGQNLEDLSPEKFAKITDTLDGDRDGQQIALAWIAKEEFRDALNLRARLTGSTACELQVRGRLFAFYDWCAQNEQVTELVTLARIHLRADPDRLGHRRGADRGDHELLEVE